MTTKQQAFAVAAKFGFELDESVSGKIGDCYCVTFDHPTKSIGPDCRSIHCSGYAPASVIWAEAIERMNEEGPMLEPCPYDDCDYHSSM